MPLERAYFYNFRNLSPQELETKARQVFFIGKNGQGKTNLLEAIYTLHLGSSFRTKKDHLLTKIGQQSWSVLGTISTEKGFFELQTKYVNGKKEVLLDGTSLKDRKFLLKLETVILFSHDDFLLVSGTAEEKRRFFDQTFIQVSDDYLYAWKRYHAFTKQRNNVLKTTEDKYHLDTLEQLMAEEAYKLITFREEWTKEFSSSFADSFKNIHPINGEIKLHYIPSISNSKIKENYWEQMRRRDLEFGFTTAGPHRDVWKITWFGHDFLSTSSTGQIRLASLSLKVAQAQFIKRKISLPLVFLLDDVLLELDPEKRKRIMELLPGYDQAFFTFLPGNRDFELRDNYLGYLIEEGKWQKTTL